LISKEGSKIKCWIVPLEEEIEMLNTAANNLPNHAGEK